MEINKNEFMRIYDAIKPHLINSPGYRAMERMTDRMAYIQKLLDGARLHETPETQNLR